MEHGSLSTGCLSHHILQSLEGYQELRKGNKIGVVFTILSTGRCQGPNPANVASHYKSLLHIRISKFVTCTRQNVPMSSSTSSFGP